MSEEKKNTDQYLELYKLAVELADRTSARRASLLTFPFTANTALFAVLFSGNFAGPSWLVAVVGLVISASWWLLLRSYRTLSAAKFTVIIEMERNLEAHIFDEEWRRTRELSRPFVMRYLRYGESGLVERFVPPIFAALYIVVLVSALI
jgi:hypothetical protein